MIQCCRNKEQFLYGGYYEHTLARIESGFKISAKKVMLLNDVVLGHVDVYHL